MDLQMLSVDEVSQIHEILVEDFFASNDPISPPGVRSHDLLESAVARQWTGLGNILKYPDPVANASTLLFGICCNHPFHNGNKRTALVAMLAHLDKNKVALFDTKQEELYDFMIEVAGHTLGTSKDRRRRRSKRRRTQDQEVTAISKWLGARAASVSRGEKPISYKDLRKILQSFNLFLSNPRNNSIDIVRIVNKRAGIMRQKTVQVQKRIGNIPYPGESRLVAMRHIKYIRELCCLREEDGIDSDAFYNYTVIIHSFVNKYRKILSRLART